MKHTNTQLRHAEYYDQIKITDKLYENAQDNKNFHKLMLLITDANNILLAFRELKYNRGCHTPGIDGLTIDDLKTFSQEELISIVRSKLKNYKPRKLNQVTITYITGKRQSVGIPSIWDRLIQQSIKQILEPICEAKFYNKSYGFRPNRSIEHALAEAISKINQNKMFYSVKVDIKEFFEKINHNKLIKQLWNLGIRDKKLLAIIKTMMKSTIISEDGTEIRKDAGVSKGTIIGPLLVNVYLNEFDWWIARQWEIFKPEKWNPKIIDNGPSSHAKVRYVIAQEGANLKPMFIVRYADDFIIFTNSKENAQKISYACNDWLSTRLKFEKSKIKSETINLKTHSVEFLGFSIKAVRKGKSNKKGHKGPRYVADTHISKKAMNHIKQSLQQQIKAIQKSPHSMRCIKEIGKYNNMVIGIHNYYQFATQVNMDLNKLAMDIERRQYNRFPKSSTATAETNSFTKKGSYNGKDAGYLPYMNSKMVRYLMRHPILPIGYVQTKNPMRKRKGVNKYTEDGRKLIHSTLDTVSDWELKYLRENPIISERATIEYNDNRISKYIGQKGKCGVTGEKLNVHAMHCHHKVPWNISKDDSYKNLIIVNPKIHYLIHATKEETILKYLREVELNEKQLNKLNKLRKLVRNENIPKSMLNQVNVI